MLVWVDLYHSASPELRLLHGIVILNQHDISDRDIPVLLSPLLDGNKTLPDNIKPPGPPGDEGGLNELESERDLTHVGPKGVLVGDTSTASASLYEQVGGDDTDVSLCSSMVPTAERSLVDPISSEREKTGKLGVGEGVTFVKVFHCSLESSNCRLSPSVSPL